MIPYARHIIGEDDIDAVTGVLRSDRITQGEKVEEFEAAVAKYTGARYAIAVNSGTAALYLAIRAAPLTYNICTSPLTFVATASTIFHAGRNIIFCDVENESLCINPIALEENDVAVCVDYAGRPCNYDDIHAGFTVADAAHSFGAKDVGLLADVTCFSFHAIKTITTGEGGMVVTSLPDIAKKVKSLRDHGRENGVITMPGFNYRMSDIQAALGLSQLTKVEKFLTRRKEIALYYDRMFSGLPVVRPATDVDSAWHLYVVRVQANKRRLFRDRLRYLGIETQINYALVSTLCYPFTLHNPDRTPVAKKAADEIVSLPMWCMEKEMYEEVAHTVRKVAQEIL